MLFAIVLGALVGVAGLTLLRQFIDGALVAPARSVLAPSDFPRLAPVQPRRAA